MEEVVRVWAIACPSSSMALNAENRARIREFGEPNLGMANKVSA
jgi:hypothetical protein